MIFSAQHNQVKEIAGTEDDRVLTKSFKIILVPFNVYNFDVFLSYDDYTNQF